MFYEVNLCQAKNIQKSFTMIQTSDPAPNVRFVKCLIFVNYYLKVNLLLELQCRASPLLFGILKMKQVGFDPILKSHQIHCIDTL